MTSIKLKPNTIEDAVCPEGKKPPMTKIKFTPGRIESVACPPDQRQIIFRDTGKGTQPGLGLRVTAAGSKSYIFQGKLAGQVIRMTLGDVKDINLSAARDRAAELRVQIRAGRDPRILKTEKTTADVARRAAMAEAKEQTLAKLLLAYCDYLEALKRDAHRDARSIFNLHVIKAFPKVAGKPAAQVSPEEIADMMRLLFEAGKGRTANKLRSYVRAAYQTAKSASLAASIPIRFKDFKITVNPAAETTQDSKQNRSAKNPLDQDGLITYWHAVRDVPGVPGAVLRLHLLTGGQRIAQMVRLLSCDITKDTITIYDGKGRPGAEPRPHFLPLIPAAKKALDEAVSGGAFALSTDGGKTHIHGTTLLKWAQEAVKDVMPGFTSKRIRSGVETLLSKHGVSKDIRGRLQSHGIAGVQDRHYDGHDYLPEKKKALMLLFNALEQKKAKVTPIRKSA